MPTSNRTWTWQATSFSPTFWSGTTATDDQLQTTFCAIPCRDPSVTPIPSAVSGFLDYLEEDAQVGKGWSAALLKQARS